MHPRLERSAQQKRAKPRKVFAAKKFLWTAFLSAYGA